MIRKLATKLRSKGLLPESLARELDSTGKRSLKKFISSLRPIETNRELIRIGGDSNERHHVSEVLEGDGGYLIPNDLEGVEVCFSPGVSEVASFELELARRGIKCFLADYSVDAPPIKNDLFSFEKKYLGAHDSDVFITLDNWVNKNGRNGENFILQMDIEGAEYEVILSASSELLRKFRIIVIEFHELDALSNVDRFNRIRSTFAKLLSDFEVVHIHPNNCLEPVNYRGIDIPPVMEFTFYRRDCIKTRTPAKSFPHRLDRKNVRGNKDFPLPKCWYE
jgi:hypothetical protein